MSRLSRQVASLAEQRGHAFGQTRWTGSMLDLIASIERLVEFAREDGIPDAALRAVLGPERCRRGHLYREHGRFHSRSFARYCRACERENERARYVRVVETKEAA